MRSWVLLLALAACTPDPGSDTGLPPDTDADTDADADSDADADADADSDADTDTGVPCSAGYEFDGVGGCQDIDECTAGTHDCDDDFELCVNSDGAWTCDDIDECLVDNGGCGPIGDFECVDQLAAAPNCVPIPNAAPEFVAIADVTLIEGDSVSFTIQTTDANFDDVELTVDTPTPFFVSARANGDGTMDVDVETVLGDSGDYTLTFHADDGDGGTALLDLGIEIAAAHSYATLTEQAHDPIAQGSTASGWGYWRYTPSGYNADADERFGAMLFFHGIGERGSNLNQLLGLGPPQQIQNGMDFDVLVFSPQLPSGSWRADDIDAWVDYLVDTYKVDRKRIYLTGLSWGGGGTWGWGETGQAAAIATACGVNGGNQNHRLNDVPLWAWHNYGDTTVNRGASVNTLNAASNHVALKHVMEDYPHASGNNAAADDMVAVNQRVADATGVTREWVWETGVVPATTGAQMFTLRKGGGHNAWGPMYGNPAVYDWLFSHELVNSGLVVDEPALDGASHHTSESTILTVSLHATDRHLGGVAGVFADFRNLGGSGNVPLIHLGGGDYQVAYTIPTDLPWRRQSLKVVVADADGNSEVRQADYTILPPILDPVDPSDTGYSIPINLSDGSHNPQDWNPTLLFPSAGTRYEHLMTDHGFDSGVTMVAVDGFSAGQYNGENPGGSGIYDDGVVRGDFYVRQDARVLRFTGLSPSTAYNFVMLSSSKNDGDQTTVFRIGSDSVSINASHNTSNLVRIDGVLPTVAGEIDLTVENGGSSDYGRLNALVIEVP